MSRYCADLDSTPLLEAAEAWRDRCLLEDGSLFSDQSIWTLEGAQALQVHFTDNLYEGNQGFFDKLKWQLEATEPEVKRLAAEMLWVMFLCPSNIGAHKKREGIRTVWEWSGNPLPEESQWLSDERLRGVGSAGTGFNTNRWRELIFFIHFLEAFKGIAVDTRRTLLQDGWRFAEWLQGVPGADKRQFRHMLLFMLFPDTFERIFGGTDRKAIVAAFEHLERRAVERLSPLEIDRRLARIRRQAEREYGTTELDFYQPPLRSLWNSKSSVTTWLVTWTADEEPWDDFEDAVEKVQRGMEVHRTFPVSDPFMRKGDRVFLRLVSPEHEGIIGTANVLTPPRHEPGGTLPSVDLALRELLDPRCQPYLDRESLSSIRTGRQAWATDRRAIPLDKKSVGLLEARWLKMFERREPEPSSPSQETPVNKIFYGPPGTGKTWTLRERLLPAYRSKERPERFQWLVQQAEEVTWFDVVFAALFDLDSPASVKELLEHPFVKAKAQARGRVAHVSNTLWSILQQHTVLSSTTVAYLKPRRSPPLVFDKNDDGKWRLAGDWREECESQMELATRWKEGPRAGVDEERFVFITFHQAYSYEDFVEGIRPVRDEATGEVGYQVVPGVFRRICHRAKQDPHHRYALFIDEINRGNIAKIFGELITLIEPDKRAVYDEAGDRVGGMAVTLPYSGEEFGVPHNLDIYGTMNTADRSIALLDTALRRRFDFEALEPDAALIGGTHGDGCIEDGEGGVIDLRRMLETMNGRIQYLLGREMMLGHSFFMGVKTFPQLKRVFLDQIVPLLQEYFYDDWGRIQLVFGDLDSTGNAVEPQIVRHHRFQLEEVFGFEPEGYQPKIGYSVVEEEELVPDSIRKIYEAE